MSALREFITQFISPAVSVAVDVDNLPERIREAIAERDRARAAVQAVRAEREHMQTAPLEGPLHVDGLMDAYAAVDAAIPQAEEVLRQADARLVALERAGHQILLQHRRAEQARHQRLADEAQGLLRVLDAREQELHAQLKDVREQRRAARTQAEAHVQQSHAWGLRGRLQRELHVNSGTDRSAVPFALPLRLSEWQRLWDGAHGAGVHYVEFVIDSDSGLVTDLVRPNQLPGFTVTVNDRRIGEVQR